MRHYWLGLSIMWSILLGIHMAEHTGLWKCFNDIAWIIGSLVLSYTYKSAK